MAQGRSSKIISMIDWIRTSRLSIKNSLSKGAYLSGAPLEMAATKFAAPGHTATWCGDIDVRVWVLVCVCVCGFGCVGVWVCGCVGVWVCGCVGVWVCGCVGVWVCGFVGV